ncbi:hypothetical protein B0H10DRAFT_1986230 [Mycena sp. CBHHK59/15]|nr:hypothetical protein B0H10DRAFT_1986230 [Mycena sp. CBHHK59/15]
MDGGFSFPPELEREILETAALRNPEMIPTLLLVCHRVHVWIEPLLYKVIVASTRENFPPLSALESKTPTFLENAVQNVYVHDSEEMYEYDVLNKLFPNCSHIVNLSVDSGLENLDLLGILDKVHLQKLALSVPSWVSRWHLAGFNHPIFLSVTHLDLWQEGPADEDQSDWRNWSGLASLPALTHLALSPSKRTLTHL